MELLFRLCAALSVGVIFGGIAGGMTAKLKRKRSTEKQIEKNQKIWKIGSLVMKYITGLFLFLGFIWCAYFLLMGIFLPEQADYANNMSGLIVSVLTVVSIIFAFYEFVRRK